MGWGGGKFCSELMRIAENLVHSGFEFQNKIFFSVIYIYICSTLYLESIWQTQNFAPYLN